MFNMEFSTDFRLLVFVYNNTLRSAYYFTKIMIRQKNFEQELQLRFSRAHGQIKFGED